MAPRRCAGWRHARRGSSVRGDCSCRSGVQKNIEVDLALITSYDALLSDLELYILKDSKQHDANTLYLLQTVPGIGKILSLVLLYEIPSLPFVAQNAT
jgi:hypothetical protein